jgi:hypothetical protein
MQFINARIDRIINRVNDYKINPEFKAEYQDRINRKPLKQLKETDLLKTFVHLIAFSQQAKSALVKKIIDGNILDKIFLDYSITKVAKMNPCDIAEKHWHKITAIRQRTKLFQIVMFARLLKQNKAVKSLLTNPPIPKSIKSIDDVEVFWKGFKKMQANLKVAKAPFLRETTTLLHFLLESGYDCIKPDSAVMKAAVKIGIVQERSGETNYIKVVKHIQLYCLEKNLRPPVVDLYLIIEGQQTEAALLVKKQYYQA